MAIRGSSEKFPLSSKKFIAFLLTILSLDVLLGVGMYLWLPLDQWSTTILLGLVVVLGVVAVGYIIGQAGLDALTHLFDVITPDSIFGKKKDPPPPEG
jgi:hypothetical protein